MRLGGFLAVFLVVRSDAQIEAGAIIHELQATAAKLGNVASLWPARGDAVGDSWLRRWPKR